MSETGIAVFDTALGPCGVAWGPKGLLGAQLPEPSREQALARLKRRFPGAVEAAPPPVVETAIRGIEALLAGAKADLAATPLDLDRVPPFHRAVYEVALTIPPGETLTYGEIAERLGDKGAARAVGEALGKNPWPIAVPCHRVLAAGGRIGGFTAPGGIDTKRRLLAIESVHAPGPPGLFG
jgi:methylated-DNA-[protein]-cysteine S-methyltransferase